MQELDFLRRLIPFIKDFGFSVVKNQPYDQRELYLGFTGYFNILFVNHPVK